MVDGSADEAGEDVCEKVEVCVDSGEVRSLLWLTNSSCQSTLMDQA